MNVLGLDIGSSSVKAGLLRNGRLLGRIARVEFPTRYDGVRAEVEPDAILKALGRAVRQLDRKSIDLIAPAVMSPSWVAMDKRGRPLTPMVTHQDRRSIDVAQEIERLIGKQRHLRLAGNRPFPGGISSTTFAWYSKHQPGLVRRMDLVGHLNTFLHRQLTGSRLTDPSNASFMGVYETLALKGWSDELCDAVGLKTHVLPQIVWADEIGGLLNRDGARLLGVRHGTPMLVGMTDAGSALLLAGARPGQLANVFGSTDVLALCTDRPRPHERLLTRALGVGRMWLSVSTLAAAGSTLNWIRHLLFSEKTVTDRVSSSFYRSDSRLPTRKTEPVPVLPVFEPYLAGDRTSMQQSTAAFSELTLATTREQMLAAVVDALARQSAQRLELLRSANPVKIHPRVLVSGGTSRDLARILRRDWRGKWTFVQKDDATLLGLARLAAY